MNVGEQSAADGRVIVSGAAADTADSQAVRLHLGRCRPSEESNLGALFWRIEEEPKGFGWKMRTKIGDRKRWYELP